MTVHMFVSSRKGGSPAELDARLRAHVLQALQRLCRSGDDGGGPPPKLATWSNGRRGRRGMYDITRTRMLMATTVFAAVAAIYAGGANARIMDESGSASGARACNKDRRRRQPVRVREPGRQHALRLRGGRRAHHPWAIRRAALFRVQRDRGDGRGRRSLRRRRQFRGLGGLTRGSTTPGTGPGGRPNAG